MFKRKSKSILLISSLIVSVFVAVYIIDGAESPISNMNGNKTGDDCDSLAIADSGLPYQVSPFFNHTDQDRNQYAELASEDLSIILYRHAFNNTDDFEITDSNITAADQFYYLMGLQRLTGAYLIPTFYDWQQSSLLWDSESTEGGFFTEMDENKTVISGQRTLYDNVLAILGALEGLYASTSLDPKTQIDNQWNTVVDLFWDDTDSLFDHTSDNTNKFSSDNLLAAIAAFQIAYASKLNDYPGLQQDALDKGEAIMNELNSSLYDPNINWEGYFQSETSGTDKVLFPNALGISALLHWNIAEGYQENSLYLAQAERLYSFLKSNLFNTTQNMYNNRMDQTGSTVVDYRLNLLDNAWMLTATIDLFKATGDITYYEDAIELFYGIEKTLYDENNRGYHDSYYTDVSQEKTFDSYNMLISALLDMKEVYDSATITTEANKSEYIYLDDNQFNVSINVNFSMIFEFNTTVTESAWNLSVPLDTAPLKYTLRYSENNTIIQSSTTSADSSGDATYLYSIDGLAVSDYKLSILCNNSAYCFTFVTQSLKISSAVFLIDYDPLFNDLYQGQTKLINVSIGSLRDDNITVDVESAGDYFTSEITEDVLVTNKSSSHAILNLTAKLDAQTGEQTFVVNLYNNSFVIASSEFTINVKPAVQVEYVSYRGYILEGSKLNVSVVIHNRKTDESETDLHIKIKGTYFNTIEQDLSSIAADSLKSYKFELEPNSVIPYGVCRFNVNVSRAGATVKYEGYSVNSVPEIEITAIESSNKIIHGQKPYISVDLSNYKATSDTIEIKSNGNTIWSGTVRSGESNINAILDKSLSNPYSVSDKTYQVTIYNSENQQIAAETITVSQEISISNVFFFYLLPVIIPAAAIVIFKYKDIENEKRLK